MHNEPLQFVAESLEHRRTRGDDGLLVGQGERECADLRLVQDGAADALESDRKADLRGGTGCLVEVGDDRSVDEREARRRCNRDEGRHVEPATFWKFSQIAERDRSHGRRVEQWVGY